MEQKLEKLVQYPYQTLPQAKAITQLQKVVSNTPDPIFRILPEDVVHNSIRQRAADRHGLAVMWTYTETGAKKMLAFREAHAGTISSVSSVFYSLLLSSAVRTSRWLMSSLFPGR